MPGPAHGPGISRAGRLEPVADIGGRVMLLDTAGPLAGESPTGWYEVTFVEPVFGLGARGAVVLWSQAATPPAGFGTLASGAASGSINAGSTVTSSPNTFQMGRHQLLQMRWLPKFVGALPGSFAVDDLDLTVALPTATPRHMTLNQQSRWNMRFQAPEPGDSTVAPAQGASQANQAAPVGLVPWDWLQMTELFIYEQTYLPTWTLINNGSANLTSANNAVVLDVMGYRLDLAPIMQADGDWVQRTLMGARRAMPRDNYVIVPITGRGVSAITQG
jgi:hypothetical protein